VPSTLNLQKPEKKKERRILHRKVRKGREKGPFLPNGAKRRKKMGPDSGIPVKSLKNSELSCTRILTGTVSCPRILPVVKRQFTGCSKANSKNLYR